MRKIVETGQRLRREGLVLVAAGSARWPMGGCAGPLVRAILCAVMHAPVSTPLGL